MAITYSNYYESRDIKVYPSAYRGSFQDDDKQISFDPEARLTTEQVLLGRGVSDLRESYVVGFEERNNENILMVVIGGYYFEINFRDDPLPTAALYLGIKLSKKTLTDYNTETESPRYTWVLASFEDEGEATLSSLDKPEGGKMYFTGLAHDTSAEQLIYSDNDGTTKMEYLYVSLGGNLIASSQLVKNINNLAGTNQALNGIRLGEANSNELYSNTDSGVNSVVYGNKETNVYPKATGDYALAGGTNTLAGGNNSVALGTGTETTSDSQFTFGKYNDATVSNAVEMVGWGTSSSAKKNIRLLDTSGNETLSGRLTAWQGGSFYNNTAVEGGNVTFNTNGTTENKSTQIGHPYYPSGAGATKNNGTFRLYASNVNINSDSNDGPVTIGNLGTSHNTTISGYNTTIKSAKNNNVQINTDDTSSSIHDGNTEIGNSYSTLGLAGTTISANGNININLATAANDEHTVNIYGGKTVGSSTAGEININAGNSSTGKTSIGNATGALNLKGSAINAIGSTTIKSADSSETGKIEIKQVTGTNDAIILTGKTKIEGTTSIVGATNINSGNGDTANTSIGNTGTVTIKGSAINIAGTAANTLTINTESSDGATTIGNANKTLTLIGSGITATGTISGTITNATDATNATNVPLSASGTGTSTITVKAGSATGATFTVNNVANATSATKLNGYALEITDTVPSSYSANTIYFIY